MKLKITNISNSETLQDLIRFTSASLTSIQSLLNGNLSFSDNINGKVDLLNNVNVVMITAKFNAPGSAGFPHSLGSVPRGYINAGQSNVLQIISDGSQPNTASTIYLNAGSTGTVKVMVF